MALLREQGSVVPFTKAEYREQLEIQRLRRDRAVSKNSVQLRRLESGEVALLFRLAVDEVAEPVERRIESDEPFALLYPKGEIGRAAPRVYSDRADFPRDLSHMNLIRDDSPASPCVARPNLQGVYDRHGIEGVITKLRSWLRDARSGALTADGWEPIPLFNSKRLGIADLAQLQEFAFRQRRDVSWASGPAWVGQGATVLIIDASLVRPQTPNIASCIPAKLREGGQAWLPTIMVWSPADVVESGRGFVACETFGELRGCLRTLRIEQPFLEGARSVLATCDGLEFASGRVGFVVLAAVRRPLPMIADAFGLSTSSAEARRFELRAYFVEATAPNALLEDNAATSEILLFVEPTPALLADVSGRKVGGAVQVLGTGALGSTLADFIGRMGVERLSLIDDDRLLPHNVARHLCRGLEIGSNKAFATAMAIQQLVLRGLSVEPTAGSVLARLDSASKVASEGHGLIVDATASEQVRRRLAGRSSEGPRIARAEIFDKGRLGVLSVEGQSGNPDLLDLYYASSEHCAVTSDNPDARRWLDEERNVDGESELRFGLTCSSISVRIPYWCVAGHAAAIMPAIARLLDAANANGGFGLSAMSEDMEPRGYAWHEVPPVKPLPAGDGWEVRVHAGALTRMREERAEHLPVETGGYLYGGWNLEAKRVNVVLASGRPPQTVSSRVALELGPSGQRREERQLLKRAAKRLWLVGAWHSHPNGSAELSRRDRKTWAEFHALNRDEGVPTVFAVIAGDEVRAHVRWE